MVWGILEDKHMGHVPGTVLLADAGDIPSEYQTASRELLKYGRGRYADVILVPQPSDSPNDPLNVGILTLILHSLQKLTFKEWPTWRKDAILLIVGLSAAVVGAYGPMLTPGFVEIAAHLDITVPVLAQTSAWATLAIGVSLFLLNPIAKKVGRRPVYVVSSIILLAGSIWGAVSQNYGSFLASRVFSALGMAPYEILVQCTIADIYFVHERATRIAIWNMFLLCGINGGSLIGGFIIQNQGWKWTFIWCAILFGVLLLLIIFFVPETAYRRRSCTSFQVTAVPKNSNAMPAEQGPSSDEQNESVSATPETGIIQEPKDSFLRSLKLYNGVYTETPLLKIFLRPVVILWYPAVLWAFLLFGGTISLIISFSIVKAVIFTEPPYNFTVSQTGLIALSPFLLAFLGEVISGPLNDWFCLWLAKKNHGVYEPEFRLPPIIISCLIGVAGFFGYGMSIHYKTHWSGPVLCYGLANMSVAFSNASVFGYIIDAHKELSEEAFVAINARNFLTFVVVYFINDWLAQEGVLRVFNILGSIFIALNVLTVPLWFFGKRIRAYIARNEALGSFMHED